MPSYKLTYFPARGAAEPARMLFHYNNVPFTDERISKADWPLRKPKTPFGQVPVLSVDSVELAQSFAIYRYIANEYGMAGTTDLEKAQVDAVADAYKDFGLEIRSYFYAAAGILEGNIDELYTEVMVPAMAKHLPNIVRVWNESGSGFLAKSGVTWVDFYISDHLASIVGFNKDSLSDFPELQKLIENVQTHPKLVKYIAERPKTVM